jgi:hypothetical protein
MQITSSTLRNLTLGIVLVISSSQGFAAQMLVGSKSLKCHLSGRQELRDKTRKACIYKCPNGKKEREVIPKGATCPGYLDVGS